MRNLSIVFRLASIGPTLIQRVFAPSGQCGNCATSFTPSALSSGLSGTGVHGVAKVFAPGQEALASGGRASDFAPGHLKS
jgi:hypothetical protein